MTGRSGYVFRQFISNARGFGVAVPALHVRKNALKGVAPLKHAAAIIDVGKLDFFVTATVQQNAFVLFGQLVKRLVDVETVVCRKRGQQMKVIDVAPIPATDCTCRKARLRVCDYALLVKILSHTQTITAIAGACWVVK